MNKNKLKQVIRKNHTQRAILPFILLICTIILFTKLFNNNFQPVKVNNLSEITSLYNEQNNFVTLTVDNLYYAGLDYSIQDNIKGHVYYTLSNGVCYLFIMSSSSVPEDLSSLEDVTLNAQLTSNDVLYSDIITALSEDLNFSEDQLSDVTIPIIVNQYSFAHSLNMLSIIILSSVGVILSILLLIQILAIISPIFSPSVYSLRKHGNLKTLFAIAELEFDTATATGRKNIFITETFIISINKYDLDIIPLDSIVWIYKFNEFRRSFFQQKMFRPLCIVTNDKRRFKIPHVSEAASNRIINTLQDRYPEILVGYDARTKSTN